MEKISVSFNKFVTENFAKFTTNNPWWSLFILVIIVLAAISGWTMAAHYHRLAQLLLIPDQPVELVSPSVSVPTTSPTAPTPPASSNAPLTPNALPIPNAAQAVNTFSQPTIPTPQINAPWHTVTVKHRDNLQRIFKRMHLSQKQLAMIMALGESAEPLKHLKPGQEIQLSISADHQLQQLIFPLDQQNKLIITRKDNNFEALATNQPQKEILKTQLEKSEQQAATSIALPNGTKFGSAKINKSLYAAGLAAGLSHHQVVQLVHLFDLDTTAAKSIRVGDQLSVLYEPSTNNNQDTILVAQLIHRDKTFQIFRYTDPAGKTDYYTADGIHLHPPIVRAPLVFNHISSYFSYHRWQPILHFFRPHFGVDYAAPYGTPIKAAGDGKLIFIGLKGGYGRTIIINHLRPYATLYAHLSRFAKGLKHGSFVHQGQIIGYVGNSGLSTGSHLHYEIHINTIPRNPLTVSLPIGAPIDKAYRANFFANTKVLLAQLNSTQKNMLASSG